MKKGLLVWNIVLSLVTLFLLIMHFSGKKKSATITEKVAGKDSSGVHAPFRIAYFEMDSIAANFDLVKALKSELQTKEEAINAEMANRVKELQKKYNYYQNLAQAGTLTEAQSEAARKEMEAMDNENKVRKAQLDQDYNTFMVAKQSEMQTKIEDFLKEYNKEKNYTYIISYEKGLFYYKDSSYNITADVVRGLNQKHRPDKKLK
ncbi:MAG TPA: OmpH family outer membrane protein [Flavisolibacter sp.]|nr:OmpH family outer membrane protein [Flavisolibacter sp.]